MKRERADFGKLTPARILRYTMDEVRYIAKGVEQIQERIRSAGCAPPRWLGPGAVAAVVLRREGVKQYMPLPNRPERIKALAAKAYFGGRVETGAVGHIEGPLYAYDLTSAYPAACLGLPCFRHGKWVHSRNKKWFSWSDPDLYMWPTALVRIHWQPRICGPGAKRFWPTWGPFPVRLKQGTSLRYYHTGAGWYWLDEVRPWLDHPEYDIRITQVWEWHQSCEHNPFGFVPKLFERRQALKAAGDPSEYTFKLILNSLYGKLAQRVGTAPFHCLEWAGIITARTRARIAEVLIRNPENVFVVATDGIIANVPVLGTDNPPVLGSWESVGTYQWADVWQPGFYIVKPKGKTAEVKTRGFLAEDVSHIKLRNQWKKRRFEAQVEIGRRRVIGYRLACHWGRPGDIGLWVNNTAHLNYNPRPRRHISNARGRLGGAQLTAAPHSLAREFDTNLDIVGRKWKESREIAEYLSDGISGGFSTG